MTDKVRQLAPMIWEEIKKANKILLHFHRGPDPDSVGGALGMAHLLKNIGKDVTIIYGDSEVSKGLTHIPGFDQVLIKNYFQIDPTQFDLFLILDSSTLGQISIKGKIVFPRGLRTVKIDHHMGDANYADINLVDTSYPAVCQMIYDLAKLWKLKINKNAAACLFTGIYTDTGGFKYPLSNYETLLIAAELAKIYPDYFRIIFEIENSNDPKQLEFLGLALSSIEHHFNNKVAISAVPYEQFKKRGIKKEHKVTDLPNMLKSVPGWIIGISLLEFEPEVVEVSFRKREYEGPDLSKAAIALGGGGHKSAAGATINQPFTLARKTLLKTLSEQYPELGNP